MVKYFDKLSDAKTAKKVVFIGYDPLEDTAAKMAAASIRKYSTVEGLKIIPIVRDELLAYDIFNRALDPKGSTQFSLTRFLVPQLMDFTGTGIFFDADMFFTRDIKDLFDLVDNKYAVQVPKHKYTPSTKVKMGGLPQTRYPKKQWSAVTIYNCRHPANRGLTATIVEQVVPSWLHQFKWLTDDQIGSIPLEYNYLVGEQKDLIEGDNLPFNIHHTLGAPLFKECDNGYADQLWIECFEESLGRPFTKEDVLN